MVTGCSPSRDRVDTNLGVLRRRIEEVKTKEMLHRCCRHHQLGWGYPGSTTTAQSSDTIPWMSRRPSCATTMSEGFELACLIFGNISVAVMGGSLLLCLTSLFVKFCLTR
ncbi:hypothetical protein MLD38_000061 [Melastoma candidum]|uniref:Uncharacterized protein n=1 Tax=Melastoma candidum TaxID=119954 RepID=A0ACB9S8M1_9MYRT|nr:hypothetical protein MLD38_000061 [Melastoma candidum]